ncbi:alpha/beta fold hydrolase [Kangiella sp. HZ709]|uniref:alpha/beta fold hydrolase n=1 Tax=Kangiella sp. HZ709 TaxID=2666328 RepID=UPI0012B05687|nr:alpha/beta hydrolase [Kangiella sp. HZ709]MRX27005.1 alpha/beta fold hydrolase [Kangiella sp. HZ709]
MNAKDWFALGSYHQIEGHKVFVIDTSPDNDKSLPVLCILHGFPTSSYDYWKVLPILQQHFRVILHDHLGFGFSDKPKDYSYSFFEQTDIAQTLWQKLNVHKAYLLAHDYGTSVLTEILARDNANEFPVAIEKVAVCNGSMHIELAKLLLMQKLLRSPIGSLIAKFSSKRLMDKNLRKIFVDPTQLYDSELDSIWFMANYNQGKNVLAKISRYTYERKQYWDRWIGALQQTQLPLEIIWPDEDPIAVAKMATTIKNETQNSNLTWLNNLGHFPMIEAPDLWANTVVERLLQHK